MLITVACPTCGRRYDVAGRLAGKKVRCKDCANTFRVPVPVTMPVAERKKPKRQRRAPKEESLEELFDSAAIEAPAPPVATRPPTRTTDLGENAVYHAIQGLMIAGLIAGWAFGWGRPLRMAILLCVLMGAFLLLPIMAGWPSFDRTLRARFLAKLVGLEGAKSVQATVAIALWVFALLVGMDTIHIQALEAPRTLPADGAKAEPARD